MLDPITLGILVATIYGVTRDKPLPLVTSAAAGPRVPQLPPRPATRPLSTAEMVPLVQSYPGRAGRYIRADLLASVFDYLSGCMLEMGLTAGGQPVPGMWRLVPFRGRPGEARASDIATMAHRRGWLFLVDLATVAPGHESDDRFVMTSRDPQASMSGQFAILGPFPGEGVGRMAPPPVSVPSIAVRQKEEKKPDTLDGEIERLDAIGLPKEQIRAALSDDEADPEKLEESAKILADFPLLKDRFEVRAGELRRRGRAKSALEVLRGKNEDHTVSNGVSTKEV